MTEPFPAERRRLTYRARPAHAAMRGSLILPFIVSYLEQMTPLQDIWCWCWSSTPAPFQHSIPIIISNGDRDAFCLHTPHSSSASLCGWMEIVWPQH